MSIIKFVCNEEQKENIIKGVWDIVKEHYFKSAIPGNTINYEYEGKDVYISRIDDLMRSELCFIDDNDNGFNFSFDLSEEVGELIVDVVYGNNMGYCDNGIKYVNNIIEAIVERYKDISFEACCECPDSWLFVECEFSYDGKILKIMDIEYEKYQKFRKRMNELGLDADIVDVAEEVGIDPEVACYFVE